ncbi:hypothetical protein Tco_1488347, partial [Tanacetum coccineum]
MEGRWQRRWQWRWQRRMAVNGGERMEGRQRDDGT